MPAAVTGSSSLEKAQRSGFAAAALAAASATVRANGESISFAVQAGSEVRAGGEKVGTLSCFLPKNADRKDLVAILKEVLKVVTNLPDEGGDGEAEGSDCTRQYRPPKSYTHQTTITTWSEANDLAERVRRKKPQQTKDNPADYEGAVIL